MTDLSALMHMLDFSQRRVLCVGDVMLDRFVYGEANRLSPEAPIPVLKVTRELTMPGGAGNVARNVGTLGATATLIGVVGEGDAAADLHEALARQQGVKPRLIACKGRKTSIKTRYVVGGQQLLRADVESSDSVEGDDAERVLEIFEEEIERSDVVIFSDYAKGMLSETVLRPALDRAVALGKPVIVDPKWRDFSRYRGATLIIPNALELTAGTGMPCDTDEQAFAAAEEALSAGIENILCTRSRHGMTLVTSGGDCIHIPARAREIHDVSGAGDTVAATVSVALASGLGLEDSARLANLAGGIVVGKVGTAVVYPQDLVAALQSADMMDLSAEIVTPEFAMERAGKWRAMGLKVGFTNGCFDLIHPGHVSLLSQAKEACDRLIVGLNTDSSVRRLKGPERPVQSETARGIVLASLAHVDLVVLFDQDTPIELIEGIKPDVLIKGSDYTKEQVVGHDVVTGYGGEVVLAKLQKGHSTTRTIASVGRRNLPLGSFLNQPESGVEPG